MKNKEKSEINPEIYDKIENSDVSENVKECIKELIEFEDENADLHGFKFKDFYLNSIKKWKKASSGDE